MTVRCAGTEVLSRSRSPRTRDERYFPALAISLGGQSIEQNTESHSGQRSPPRRPLLRRPRGTLETASFVRIGLPSFLVGATSKRRSSRRQSSLPSAWFHTHAHRVPSMKRPSIVKLHALLPLSKPRCWNWAPGRSRAAFYSRLSGERFCSPRIMSFASAGSRYLYCDHSRIRDANALTPPARGFAARPPRVFTSWRIS
jgi:hypothetical protein